MCSFCRKVLFAAMLCCAQAKADWSLDFNTYFGASSLYPGVPAPWASVSFVDVAPGTVMMTVSNSAALSSTIKMDGLYLNLNPTLNPSSLTFSLQESGGSFAPPTITTGTDSFMASEDGRFDIRFQFNSGGGTGSTFNGAEYAIFEITGVSGLQADDFEFLSSHNNGGNSAYAVAHLLGINNGSGSAWIAPSSILTVPEPSPFSLAMVGVASVVLGRRIPRGRGRG